MALALLAAAVYLLAGGIAEGRGATLYSLSGDAWKNVYTFAYHVLHDPSPMQTEALHWPWGDQVAMSDAQPPLSNLLRPLARAGLVDERGLTSLVLLLPLASILACGAATYALLRALGLSRAAAAAWGLGIALLQPQVTRINAHYALAYAWAFPLLTVLWLRARRRGYPPGRSLAAGAVLLGLGVLHLYYVGMGGALLLGLLAADFALHRRVGPARAALATALQVVAPAALAVGYARWGAGDHPDRIATPYGLFEYVSNPWGIVTHAWLPHWRWVDEHVVGIDWPVGEGWAYLGLAPAVALLAWGGYAAARAVRRRPVSWPVEPPCAGEALTCLAVAAGLLIVFSWGFPLGLRGSVFDAVREAAGPLRQLRALGRFAWAAYFPATAVAAVLFAALASRRRWGRAVAYGAAALTCAEGASIYRVMRATPVPHGLLARADAIRAAVPDGEAYAAVIPVPYFHVGSEDFVRPEIGRGLYTGTYPSLALGIPNAGLYLSRTPFSEARRSVVLEGSWWNVPEVLAAAGPEARFLLAVDAATFVAHDWVREAYGSVVGAAEGLYADEFVRLYALPAARLPEAVRRRRRGFARAHFGGADLRALDSLLLVCPGEVAGACGLSREGFDDRGNSSGMGASPGFPLDGAEGAQRVASLPLPVGVRPGGAAALNLQVRLRDQGQIFFRLDVVARDAAGGELHREHRWGQLAWSEVDDDGWAFVEAYPALPPGTATVDVEVTRSTQARSAGAVVDEVTLRAAGTHYAYPLGDGHVVDGRLWRPL